MTTPGPLTGAPLSFPDPDIDVVGLTFIDSLARLDELAPADGAGVRLLNTPGCVKIITAITLPAGQRLVLGNNTALGGCDADQSGLLGDVDAPLISGSGDGVVVADLFLRNFNVGPNAYCVEVTNGFNPVGRVSRVERSSVGGTRGVRVFDATQVSINVLCRCTDKGIVLEGSTGGVQILDSVFNADLPSAPTFIEVGGTLHSALRIDRNALNLTPGSMGLEVVGAPTLELVRVGNNDFIPNGGTAILPAGLQDVQADVFFVGNSGTEDSTFGGSIGYNGNPTGQVTVIPAAGSINPDGSVAGAVRVGNGNATHPAFVLNPASARVALVQPGGADTAQLAWAALDAANVTVAGALSVRSADGLTKAVAGQIVRLPGGVGPAQFVTAFTSVTGGLLLAAGFVDPRGGINAIPPGDTIAVEVANLTDAVDLIVDSVNLSMRSVD